MKTSKDSDDLVDWIRLVPARTEEKNDFKMTMKAMITMTTMTTMITMTTITITMTMMTLAS